MLSLIPLFSDVFNQALYLRCICLCHCLCNLIGRTVRTYCMTNGPFNVQICTSWLKNGTRYSEFKRELRRKSPPLPPSGTISLVLCRTSSHTTGPDDLTSIRSLSVPANSLASTENFLLRDQTSNKPTILPLRNLSPAFDTVRFVPGNCSSRSSCVHREIVSSASEKLGSHLRTKIDMKIKRTMRQQLDALLRQ